MNVILFLTKALSVLLILLLSACGGGGGSNDGEEPENLTVTVNAGIGGSASPEVTTVTSGETASIAITPDSGFAIQSASGCSGSLAGNTYITGSIISNCTVSVSFIENSVALYTVSSSAGSGGSISPSSVMVPEGDTTSFNLTADTGFLIDSVSGCSGALSGNTYTTGTITEDCVVEAAFSPVLVGGSFTVTATAGPGGVVSPATQTVDAGENAFWTVTPNSAYEVETFSGSCTPVVRAGVLIVGTGTPVTSNCELMISFVDADNPSVSMTVPESFATDVAINSLITVEFSEAMDVASFNYDGQGFMVKSSLGVDSAFDLDGASVCFQADTTTELNLADFFSANNMSYTAIRFDTSDQARSGFESGRCDVLTSDQSELYSLRIGLADPSSAIVLPEVISNGPLGPVVHQNDSIQLVDDDGNRVNGVVTYDEASNQATFTPATTLLPLTRYNASVSATVTDLVGKPMLENYTWSFSTENTLSQGNGWGTEDIIGLDSEGVDSLEVGVDGNGNAIAVWFYDNLSDRGIYYNRYNALDNRWGAPAELIAGGVTGEYLSLSVNNTGNAILVWNPTRESVSDPHQLNALHFDSILNSWGAVRELDTDIFGYFPPSVRIDNDGNAIALWSRALNGDVTYTRYTSNSDEWSTPELIEPTVQSLKTGLSFYNGFEMDANGNAVVTWQQPEIRGLSASSVFYSSYFDVNDAVWNTAERLDFTVTAIVLGELGVFVALSELDMSHNGDAIVRWQQASSYESGGPGPLGEYVRRFDFVSKRWGDPVLLESLASGEFQSEFVGTSMNSPGDAAAISREVDGSGNIAIIEITTRFFDALADIWSAPEVLESNVLYSFFPEIILDDNGDALIIGSGDVPDVADTGTLYSTVYRVSLGEWSEVEPAVVGVASVDEGRVKVAHNNGIVFVFWVDDGEIYSNRFEF